MKTLFITSDPVSTFIKVKKQQSYEKKIRASKHHTIHFPTKPIYINHQRSFIPIIYSYYIYIHYTPFSHPFSAHC
ncbi:hypothetical protein Hanom_Chr02g00137491 [Helianthus anomalus]